jgi:hypothetical protein
MNDDPLKRCTGYLVERIELSIRKVAYTRYDVSRFQEWQHCTIVYMADQLPRVSTHLTVQINPWNNRMVCGQLESTSSLFAHKGQFRYMITSYTILKCDSYVLFYGGLLGVMGCVAQYSD